ncbi:MAG TPA: nucleotidyltransferase family protein [Planctomycetota bacterium]|nr:nucleotidyltransferase family protein [Planctomycetota bacterium]
MSAAPMLPVVILAGGLGTRIRQYGENVPKALLDINGEPFLAHQLRLLQKNGIRHVILCIGHLAEQIESFTGDGSRFGLKVEFSYDGPVLLGTAGAIRNALPKLHSAFFVLYGDSYLTCDYAAIQKSFLRSRKKALMTVLKNEGRWDKSNVEFANGKIRVYDKKLNSPAMKHIDYGLGVFQRSVFEALPTDQKIDLAAVYRDLLAQGELAAYEVPERFYEIGSPEGLLELRAYLAGRTHEEK